jgi:serine/threonine-protein kinase
VARGRIDRVVLDALGSLTDDAAASNDLSVIAWAEKAVALFPMDGPSVRRLMEAQANAGHRSRALDLFEGYKRRLLDEFGLEPAPELVTLATRIRTGDVTLHAAASTVAPPSERTVRVEEIRDGSEVDKPSETNPADPHIIESAPLPGAPATVSGGSGRPRARWLAIGFAAAVATVAGLALIQPDSPAPVLRAEVTPPESSALPRGFGGVGFALSPEGDGIVYVGEGPDDRMIWERRLDDIAPRPISGTEGAWDPVYSPGGTAVAFWQDESLKTVSLAGGPVTTLVAGLAEHPYPTWDGRHTYYSFDHDIYRVAAEGGQPERITATFGVEQGGARARLASVLPDGQGLVVTLWKYFFASSVGVVGPEGGEVRELFDGTTARYTASGHLVYSSLDGTLMAVPFDPEEKEVTGPHVELVSGIPLDARNSAAQFAILGTGALVYRTAEEPPLYEAAWVDRSGRATDIDPDWTFRGDARSSSVTLSPDNERLALATAGDIWLKSFDDSSIERFTFDSQGNRRPWWSGDGTRLTFTHSPRSRVWELRAKRSDGTGEATVVLPFGVGTASYSADERWLIYSREKDSGDSDLFACRVGDTDDLTLVATSALEYNPALSPDGRWLAYTSNESGQFEVYVRSFPNVEEVRKQVSTAGGTEVRWSPSGRELFYRDGAGQMVAVDVVTDSMLSLGTQTVLFGTADFLSNVPHPSYDVSADGSRFVMIRQEVPLRPSELILVQNFVRELSASVSR